MTQGDARNPNSHARARAGKKITGSGVTCVIASPGAIRAALEAVLAREPELSMFGLGVWDQRRLSPEERAVILEGQRAELLQSRQVAAAIGWLGRIRPRKTINPKRSSYGLKHIVERDIGYLTNGEFIAAAIIAGFGYKRIGHGPNVAFAMSERSIKAAVALRRMARGGDR